MNKRMYANYYQGSETKKVKKTTLVKCRTDISKLLWSCVLTMAFFSCKPGKHIPDITHIKASVRIVRFEQDFFQSDTTHLQIALRQLSERYPAFFNDFMYNILGLSQGDTTLKAVKNFLTSYYPIYQSSQKQFADFSTYQKEIEQGFRFIKYYFPSYPLADQIITFIGPMDALFTGSIASYGDALTASGPAIGLQLHLGENHPAYQTGMEAGALYAYQTKRFTAQTISVNVMKNIIDDILPYAAQGRPLIEQMIEKGKRLYVLDCLLPYTADTLKIGYTNAQLRLCDEHEADIWNFFVRNDLIFSIEPAINKEYVEDGPKTQVLGEGVPGYLGLYVGWQIVKKWMEKNSQVTLDALLRKNAKELFNEAGYKPK